MAYGTTDANRNTAVVDIPATSAPNGQTTAKAAVVQQVAATLTPLGYQQITSLSSATALTVPTGATSAVIVPETQAVRWRDDGTNPTATVGMPLAVGSELVITGSAALAATKFFEQAASAKLNVNYYS